MTTTLIDDLIDAIDGKKPMNLGRSEKSSASFFDAAGNLRSTHFGSSQPPDQDEAIHQIQSAPSPPKSRFQKHNSRTESY